MLPRFSCFIPLIFALGEKKKKNLLKPVEAQVWKADPQLKPGFFCPKDNSNTENLQTAAVSGEAAIHAYKQDFSHCLHYSDLRPEKCYEKFNCKTLWDYMEQFRNTSKRKHFLEKIKCPPSALSPSFLN